MHAITDCSYLGLRVHGSNIHWDQIIALANRAGILVGNMPLRGTSVNLYGRDDLSRTTTKATLAKKY